MSTFYPELEISLENPALMKEYLIFYWFETWEKLLQIEAFVQSREHRRSLRKAKTINNFQESINRIQKNSINLSFLLCLILREINR